MTVTLGGTPVPLPHGAFLQATAEGEGALVHAVREAVGPARIVADLREKGRIERGWLGVSVQDARAAGGRA